MKLIKTISKLVVEAQKAYDQACDKGVNEKELDRLEKNLQESIRLMKLYDKMSNKSQN